jgi:hypothetical protein
MVDLFIPESNPTGGEVRTAPQGCSGSAAHHRLVAEINGQVVGHV